MVPRNLQLGGRATGILVALALSLCLAAVAFGLPPFTTAPKSSPGSGGQAELSGVDAGCHATFDRLVVRARFATSSYDVRYVNRIIADPSGVPVALLGTTRIRVVIRNARGHTNGGTNLLPGLVTPLCPNLRQIRKAGDFEGVVSFGLGLRHKTGFRVFRLSGPTRIVVDVAH
ncbi:MAG: Peptidoglycan-binding domain 1 protein [Solirubrobacterales bacterium]|nr:Peptidoglycan-binding domain 1 protein [Solirubrobacterales bacterium]